MEQRISPITLGVADLARSIAFYEALGWHGTEVDDIMSTAAKAGATVTKSVAETFNGGYVGYFTGLDGHVWEEIAHNPGFTLKWDGALTLPDFTG